MEKEVKQIIKGKKDIVVFIDDEKLILDEDIYSSHYLYAGKKINDEEYNAILKEIRINPQINYVIRLMSAHYYFEKELRQKLKKRKLSPEEADSIIVSLKDKGISCDEEYIKYYIEELERKNFGYNRIIKELNNKGLDYNYPYDEDEEYERGSYLLDGYIKQYKNYSFDKMKQSIYKSYLTLGYNSSNITKYLNSLNKDDFINQNKDNLEKDYLKITMHMDEEQIKLNYDKIMKKLLAKGYHYDEIRKITEG